MTDSNERLDPRLEAEIAKLPREIEAPPEVWAGIEREIRRESDKKTGLAGVETWRWLAMAAVLLLTVGSIAIGLRGNGGGGLPPMTSIVDVGSGRNSGPDAQSARFDIGPPADEVFGALDARAEELDPETVETIKRNMTVIEDALGEIQEALEQDPSNPQLGDMWDMGVRQRGEVLRKAALLAGSA